MINVCEILGTEYPIIQGAMARIAECNLAAAVSNGRCSAGWHCGFHQRQQGRHRQLR